QMPFTDQAGNIARLGEDTGNRGKLFNGVVGARSDLGTSSGQIAVDTVLGRHQAGQKGGSSWGADRVVGEGSGKEDSFAGQLVDIWRENILITVATQRPGPVIVSQNQYDICQVRLCCSRCQDKKEA